MSNIYDTPFYYGERNTGKTVKARSQKSECKFNLVSYRDALMHIVLYPVNTKQRKKTEFRRLYLETGKNKWIFVT